MLRPDSSKSGAKKTSVSELVTTSRHADRSIHERSPRAASWSSAWTSTLAGSVSVPLVRVSARIAGRLPRLAGPGRRQRQLGHVGAAQLLGAVAALLGRELALRVDLVLEL